MNTELARALERASNRGVRWLMTVSSHPDILSLFEGNNIMEIPKGTGSKPGLLTENSGEALILNY
jgi:DNA adenine methylase